MKAWTYKPANDMQPYWKSYGVSVVMLEYDDGHLEFHRVDDGRVWAKSEAASWHKGQLLAPKHYPRWYVDMDPMSMDTGL